MTLTHKLQFYILISTTLCSNYSFGQSDNLTAETAIPTIEHFEGDSAKLNRLLRQYNIARNSENDSLIILSLFDLSAYNQTTQNYSSAFEYAGEALFLAEEISDTILLAKACQAFGVLNYMLYQKSEAEHYLQRSLSLYKYLLKEKKTYTRKLVWAYFHITLMQRHFKEFETALVYLDSCYAVSDTIRRNPIDMGYLDVEKGILLSSLDKPKPALDALNKAKRVFEQLKPDDREALNKEYLVIIYTYLGIVQNQLDNYSASNNYFQNALKFLKKNKRHKDLKPFIHEQYALLLHQIEEYKKAYDHLQESKELNEKFFSTKAISNNDFITIRSRYMDEINEKNDEILRQNLELAQNKQSIIMFRAILYSFILLLVIGGLIIRNRFQVKKHRKEKELNIKKQKDSERLLELKNKELTESTLKLIEKEEMMHTVREHLKSQSDNQESKVLLNTLKHNEDSLWNDFNTRFVAVNKDFYNNLQAEFPKLSPGDLKICALIKLNFSGKEMAHLLGISIDSVHKARHRLRKKMNLDRSINLTSYISSI